LSRAGRPQTKRLRFYSNGSDSLLDGATTMVAGQWTHVAATFDGTTRRLYVNGVLDVESVRSSPLPGNTEPLRIGADVGNLISTYPWVGQIADVRLWSVARTRAEIRRDLVRLFEARPPGLIAAWHLEGSPAEVFGRHPGVGVGTVAWNGPAAPPVVFDPIRVPRLALAPVVTGACEPGEYGSGALRLQLPIWLDDVAYPPSPVWVSVGATASDLFICMERAEMGAHPLRQRPVGLGPGQHGPMAVVTRRVGPDIPHCA